MFDLGSAARPHIDLLRDRLKRDVARGGCLGITAGIVAGDRLVWAEGFGIADKNREQVASVDTLYRIGSISKTFTAAVLAQLVQRGEMTLDDPIAPHLAEAGQFGNSRGDTPVTFRHLVTHMSGLRREPARRNFASGPIHSWEEKVLGAIPRTFFDFSPGLRYSYSDIGYGVLGLALSRAVAVPYMQLVSREIFQPLAMDHSTFVIGPEQQDLLSRGHEKTRLGFVDVDQPEREHQGRGYKVPNGGIYSTVGDMARFIAGLTGASGDAILNEESRALMRARHTPVSGTGYGLGLWLKDLHGVSIAGHGGSVAGYTAHIAFEANSRVGVIFLRNFGWGRKDLANLANETLVALLSGKSALRTMGAA